MAEPSSAALDTPVGDAVGTTGLILNMAAIIAFALCLASVSAGSAAFAIGAGAVAAVTFTASLVILMVHGKRFEDAAVTVAS